MNEVEGEFLFSLWMEKKDKINKKINYALTSAYRQEKEFFSLSHDVIHHFPSNYNK